MTEPERHTDKRHARQDRYEGGRGSRSARRRRCEGLFRFTSSLTRTSATPPLRPGDANHPAHDCSRREPTTIALGRVGLTTRRPAGGPAPPFRRSDATQRPGAAARVAPAVADDRERGGRAADFSSSRTGPLAATKANPLAGGRDRVESAGCVRQSATRSEAALPGPGGRSRTRRSSACPTRTPSMRRRGDQREAPAAGTVRRRPGQPVQV
jgi:hypothetical protein